MIKHRQVQRRGRRSQMTTRYGGAGMGRQAGQGGWKSWMGSGSGQSGPGQGAPLPAPHPSTLSFTDPSVSMDLLRAVLQPSINEEIQGIFNKYMKVSAGDSGQPQGHGDSSAATEAIALLCGS